VESLDTDTWEISFGDFDMGVVDGNPGNQIHNIQVKKFHSSKNFFYHNMISFATRNY